MVHTEYSGIYVLIGIVFAILITAAITNIGELFKKESTRVYGMFAVAIGVCVFLLHYAIPLLFIVVGWTFTQALYVRAGVVSMIVGIAVFLVCVTAQVMKNESD